MTFATILFVLFGLSIIVGVLGVCYFLLQIPFSDKICMKRDSNDPMSMDEVLTMYEDGRIKTRSNSLEEVFSLYYQGKIKRNGKNDFT
jgi:hypothetical protein